MKFVTYLALIGAVACQDASYDTQVTISWRQAKIEEACRSKQALERELINLPETRRVRDEIIQTGSDAIRQLQTVAKNNRGALTKFYMAELKDVLYHEGLGRRDWNADNKRHVERREMGKGLGKTVSPTLKKV